MRSTTLGKEVLPGLFELASQPRILPAELCPDILYPAMRRRLDKNSQDLVYRVWQAGQQHGFWCAVALNEEDFPYARALTYQQLGCIIPAFSSPHREAYFVPTRLIESLLTAQRYVYGERCPHQSPPETSFGRTHPEELRR